MQGEARARKTFDAQRLRSRSLLAVRPMRPACQIEDGTEGVAGVLSSSRDLAKTAALHAGSHAHLAKPVDLEQLRKLLR
jgi:hypothetical protein